MAQVSDFDVSQLSGVLIVCGHYGVGKTAFSLSLAKDAFRAGKHVTLVDLDVVNPYFRSSDQAQSLRAAGISVITPVYAGPDCNIDMPALTGAVAPAIERASSDAGELCIIDVGGDDAGAAALGRFSRTIASAPYEMWYVATEEIVGHDRAADGRDANGLTLDIKLIHGLAHEAMDDAVRAPWTIVGHHRQQGMRAGEHELLVLRH